MILIFVIISSCSRVYEDGEVVDIRGGVELIAWKRPYRGVSFMCHAECPAQYNQVIKRIDSVADMFDPHLTRDPDKLLYGTNIIWTSSPMGSEESPIWGLTFSGMKDIYIYFPYSCPEEPKGLCGGIFDYELGHIFMQHDVMPGSTEREWLDYRIEHDLLYSQDSLSFTQ